MKVSELLEAAKAKIEGGWIRGMRAVDANSCEVDPYQKEACSFCSIGAIVAAYFELDNTEKPETFLHRKDRENGNWLCGAEKSPIAMEAIGEAAIALVDMRKELLPVEARFYLPERAVEAIWRINDSDVVAKEHIVTAFEKAVKAAKEREDAEAQK